MKLLIADDERLIREAIVARLRKGKYEFEEILQAENGLEARQLIREHHPEIVITDVRMDGMSGLDLIKSCQSSDTVTAYIVISGYAEFEYVQTAMYHGACCYLLKPITHEKLFDALEKAKEKYEAMKRLTKAEEENTLLTLNHLFQKCIRNSLEDKEYGNMLTLLGTDTQASFLLGVAHLSRYNQDRYFSIENVYSTLSSALSSKTSIPFMMLPGEIGANRHFIFWDSNLKAAQKELFEIIESQIRKLKIMGAAVTIGLSPITHDISREAFAQGEQALNKRFLSGNGRVYYSGNEDDLVSKNLTQLDLKTLSKELRFQSPIEIQHKLFDLLETYYPLVHNFEYLIQYIYEILNILDFRCSKEKWDSFITDKYWTLCENKEEILEKIKAEITVTCQQQAVPEEASVTRRTKDYLEANYMENLTLDIIAGQHHLNPRYFSTIFKKEEGISPMDYLTRLRMEAAKNILSTTDTPASLIAQMAGYEDPRYFYKVFKKHTGLTPKEYRLFYSCLNQPQP